MRPGGGPPASQIAREKARDKALTVYIHLACGHLTTWQTQEEYEYWRPKGKFWCEHRVCGRWVLKARKPPRPPDSNIPLFLGDMLSWSTGA